VLPFELKVRGSTAPPKGTKPSARAWATAKRARP
jgi:hypothetical protein